MLFKRTGLLHFLFDFYVTVPKKYQFSVRKAVQNNAALIWVFSKPGLTTPPPRIYRTFGALFRRLIFWNSKGTFLYHHSLKIRGKRAQQLFDLVRRSHLFVTKSSKIVGAQKVPQNFWIGSELDTIL